MITLVSSQKQHLPKHTQYSEDIPFRVVANSRHGNIHLDIYIVGCFLQIHYHWHSLVLLFFYETKNTFNLCFIVNTFMKEVFIFILSYLKRRSISHKMLLQRLSINSVMSINLCMKLVPDLLYHIFVCYFGMISW